MYKCPECSAHIEHLFFNITGVEYGTFYIENEDYDRDGTDFDGDPTFSCPECDCNIDDWQELEKVEEEEKIEEKKEEEEFEIKEPKNNTDLRTNHRSPGTMERMLIKSCPKCNNGVEFSGGETETNCIICNSLIELGI